MLRVNCAKQGLLSLGFAVCLMGAMAALAADASAPAASSPDATTSAPGAAPGSVQAAMALGAKATQQLQEDKKKQEEEERLKGFGGDWESWTPENSVSDTASLQRGLRDFAGYCRGCHSLKYMRYSRLGQDLQIPSDQLAKFVLPAGAKPSDYVTAPMPATDALYRFLTTFYSDPSRTTGANNLQLASVAMPHVLSSLEGVKVAVFKNGVFDHFVQVAPGSQSHEEYLATVRDLVNFLDYVGEPAQVQRRSLGVKVVLFLLAFTALTYLLKREYWKNVH
jgi:ubiquinol-cytochrome c reductase cytochrome c1 subunit